MTVTSSIWQSSQADDGSSRTDLAQLGLPRRVDACVVGAGMSGLLIALELLERGLTVIVLDRSRIGAGETEKTTAHLTSILDTRYYELQRMHGEDVARLVASSHQRGLAHLERVANVRRIACDFHRVDAFLFATREEQKAALEREQKAASEAGIACSLLRSAPLPFAAGPALHVPGQGKFHPLQFLAGVAAAIRSLGGLIAAPAQVQEVSEGPMHRIETSRGQVIEASHVVIATDSPINDVFKIHTKQAPYRSYAVALRLNGGDPLEGLFWDLEDPYHYVRTARPGTSGDRVLIVGGEDHKVGQESEPEQCWERLESWTRERFAMAGPILNRWSGQILEPSDGLAYIGKNPGQEGIYVATGHSGNGMTYAAVSALLIADLITGVQNPWSAVYDPSRKPKSLSALASYASENLNVAAQYLDWVKPGDVSNHDAIPAGEGAILRRGLSKVAVYRDPMGQTHEFSATCPHLGGVLAWNRAEKSWDCPCHGSRFDCYGKVLNGPAVTDLVPADGEDDDGLETGVEVVAR